MIPSSAKQNAPMELVIHRPPILLLDSILEATEEKCIATVSVNPAAWYAAPDGSMPGWFGIELMAQTIGAYSGARKQEVGIAPKLGFLLGTRNFETRLASFAPGEVLEVEVRPHYLDETGLSAFLCEIRHHGQQVASATLTTFEQP